MKGNEHHGGVRGWRAMRGTCPLCGRDTALSPPRMPHKTCWTVKRHYADGHPCLGIGQAVPSEAVRFPDASPPPRR